MDALWNKFKTTPSGGFQICPVQTSPSGKIPDGIFLQAGLAVFAFRGLRTLKQKHRCAFRSLPRIKQFMRY
ncbi:MAG: hypothetical protein J6X06_06895 [Elusimicrobiaceae bacterium]|nr:hypothetical protein [Elusimicrobiaceae bacterium]